MRIVSLLPAATEWICAFGAEQYLVGRSHLTRDDVKCACADLGWVFDEGVLAEPEFGIASLSSEPGTVAVEPEVLDCEEVASIEGESADITLNFAIPSS